MNKKVTVKSGTKIAKVKKEISLKDLISVDYTDGSWPEDKEGQLAYDYYKRVTGVVGEDNNLEEKASWIDGYIDKYTQMVYNNKDETLTLTWRNYEKYPKVVKVDKASWEMLRKSQNRPRLFNQLWMDGKITLIKEDDDSIEEAADTHFKYELNAKLRNINTRIKSIRAAHPGSTNVPKDISDKLARLVAERDHVLSMLKEDDIVEDEFELTEALNIMQRMKRRSIMRRNKAKILAGRRRAQRRRASTSVIQQRSIRAARAALARRILRKSKGEASYAEKVRVEKMLSTRQGAIKRLARKFMSRIRQKEQQKYKHAPHPRPIQSIKPNR